MKKTWKKVQKGYQNDSKINPKSIEKGRRKKGGKSMGFWTCKCMEREALGFSQGGPFVWRVDSITAERSIGGRFGRGKRVGIPRRGDQKRGVGGFKTHVFSPFFFAFLFRSILEWFWPHVGSLLTSFFNHFFNEKTHRLFGRLREAFWRDFDAFDPRKWSSRVSETLIFRK